MKKNKALLNRAIVKAQAESLKDQLVEGIIKNATMLVTLDNDNKAFHKVARSATVKDVLVVGNKATITFTMDID